MVAQPMTTEALNQLLNLALALLAIAHANVLPIGLGLLGATIAIELYLGFLFASLDGYVNLNRLLGVIIIVVLQAFLSSYIMINLPHLTQAFWDTFIQMATVSAKDSGPVIGQMFNHPSFLWDRGYALSKPLIEYLGWPSDMMWFHIAGWTIQLMFMIISFCALLARIEFAILVPLAVVLIGLGLLSPFSFLLSGTVRSAFGVLVRVFVLAIIVTLATLLFDPLISGIALVPDQKSASIAMSLSIGLAVLTWALPSIFAGQVAGAGSGLGMGSLIAFGAVGASTVSMGLGVVRGVSRMIRSVR